MKKIIFLAIIVLHIGCKENKQLGVNIKEEDVSETKDINASIVFNDLLMNNTIKNAEYKNITFNKKGAVFSKTKNSYIKIPFNNLDIKSAFNVSFTYNTSSDDGTKPQTLIAFADKYSSPSRIPFYIYYPGNKISGVYGKQLLWAENYESKNGNSRAYYDSFTLSKDKNYFVSVNFHGSKIDFYVNGELYASFENIKLHDFNFDHLMIGGLTQGEKGLYPFEGNIHGLKIFNTVLNNDEILSVFNSQPEIGEDY